MQGRVCVSVSADAGLLNERLRLFFKCGNVKMRITHSVEQ